ncbi:MAG TPA: hypothetical protein VMW87_13185 [Spirochaetia bacterium]|nr:hypothetical protein [Spirochaetia bacterium]
MQERIRSCRTITVWKLLQLLGAGTALCATLSCSNGLLTLLSRTMSDPAISRPAVDSLAVEGRICISWDIDPGADSYRLYRECSPEGAGRMLVYTGRGSRFEDRAPGMDIIYYYRLAKVRGEREFEMSDYVPGVASGVAKDSEDNDRRENATLVTFVTPATIHYFRDGIGNEIEDRDWYAMIVPPRSFITVAVTDTANTSIGELYFQVAGRDPALLASTGGERSLHNYELTAQPVYFQIYVSKDDFVGVTGAPGGKIASYQVEYVLTTAIR